jgi:uncharacterized protein DUF3592
MLTLFPQDANPSPEERAMIAVLAQLPRPRQVSIRLAGLIAAISEGVLAFGAGIYFFVAVWAPKAHESSLYTKAFLACFTIMLLYVVVEKALAFVRNRELLATGEVALGRVFYVTRGKNPRMEFAFRDTAGHTITTQRSRPHSSIRKGSAVVIFYDPSDPKKRCVPLCSTLWQIDLPSDSTAATSSSASRV